MISPAFVRRVCASLARPRGGGGVKDRYGNDLTTVSSAARDAYVAAVDNFLAAGPNTSNAFLKVVELDDGFALAHAGLARAYQSFGRGAEARQALEAAEARLGGVTPREASHVAMLGLAIRGKSEQARLAAMAHAVEWPRDAIITGTLMGVFSLLGFSGRPGREIENLSISESLAPHFGDDWWFLAQLSFAQLESGLLDAAQPNIERALELHPRNANAAHYRAHLYYEMGETREGLAFLSDWMTDYDRAGLMHCHNSWHIALWSLATGDEAGMWARVDQDLRPGVSLSPSLNILTDLAALYARAEWAGIRVAPERWKELSTYAIREFPKPGVQFADIHAALAHAMAGEGAALERLVRDAAGPAADIVQPTAEAFGALARMDWASALSLLTPVMSQHARFGGSRAQRDIVEYAVAIALLRLGKGQEAARLLAMHRPRTDFRSALPDLPELSVA